MKSSSFSYPAAFRWHLNCPTSTMKLPAVTAAHLLFVSVNGKRTEVFIFQLSQVISYLKYTFFLMAMTKNYHSDCYRRLNFQHWQSLFLNHQLL